MKNGWEWPTSSWFQMDLIVGCEWFAVKLLSPWQRAFPLFQGCCCRSTIRGIVIQMLWNGVSGPACRYSRRMPFPFTSQNETCWRTMMTGGAGPGIIWRHRSCLRNEAEGDNATVKLFRCHCQLITFQRPAEISVYRNSKGIWQMANIRQRISPDHFFGSSANLK